MVMLLISDLECHSDLECQNLHQFYTSNNSIQFHPGYLPDGKARHVGGNVPTRIINFWGGILDCICQSANRS